jgi:uncharacterized membrane protein YbaN (DUF454 family)
MPRLAYLVLGWVCVALAVIGALLPIMPTTVFLIAAAFLFGRGSPRARAWLLGHPLLGPPIRKWEETGAISPGAKALATGAMALSVGLAFLLGAPGWVLVLQTLCLAAAGGFVLTRPS